MLHVHCTYIIMVIDTFNVDFMSRELNESLYCHAKQIIQSFLAALSMFSSNEQLPQCET